MSKTFVGFGFGAIQAGLFLYEAFRSGNFNRLVAIEVNDNLVQSVRKAGGTFNVNIAHFKGIESVTIPGIEIYNPQSPSDRDEIISALSEANEIATAVPSVDFYLTGKETSIAALLSKGINKQPERKRVIYTAENNNQAAEIMTDYLNKLSPLPANTQILNTVIGKMSGVITDTDTIKSLRLKPVVEGFSHSLLVEEFNKILISKIKLNNFKRGIEVFIEKPDLLPFEEAKLYGHNAIHILLGGLAFLRGYKFMAQANNDTEIMSLARQAFLEESGSALCKKYHNLNDPLFTPPGYQEYADDLLKRMTNPYLNDLVERVFRDPQRKLGYNDRVFGTMRLALKNNIEPKIMGLAGAIGLYYYKNINPEALPVLPNQPTHWKHNHIQQALEQIWEKQAVDEYKPHLVGLVVQSIPKLL